jgi:hypothetical protein
MRTLFLAIVLLACCGRVAAAEAEPRKVPQGWLGVTADGPIDARDGGEWDRMARSGVETVRLAFRWFQLQPAPDALDLSGTDAAVAAAAARGITVLPVLEQVPAWAATRPGDLAAAPRDPATYGRFAAALVARYGPAGTLWRERPRLPRMPIRAWQIANEPNLQEFWSEQPYAPTYVTALRAAAGSIRAADPGATIVMAGLSNESWTALAAIYAAGARGAFDAVAIHPYTALPADAVRIVRLARRVMRANGDAALPIWVTELSWPAAKDRPGWKLGWEVTDRRQAKLLATAMRMLVRARTRLKLSRVFWYTWISAEQGPSPFDWSGLRRRRGGDTVSAPVMKVFRRAARVLQGCAKSTDARRCA